MSKKALGRGLSSLFTQTGSIDHDLIEIALDLVDPNPGQPRQIFKQDKLEELAASMTSSGIIQPLVVRRVDERYQIIAGERRWRAAQLAGLHRLPCVVKQVSDEQVLELSLIENLQRESLNPIEEAAAYKSLLERLGCTQEQLADRVGKDRSSVANSLRLLKLPKEIQRLVEEEKLSMGHARALIAVESPERQREIAAAIVARGLSVREAEALAKKAASNRTNGKARSAIKADPNVTAAETKLKRRLGAPVKIKLSGSGGLIEVRFSSMEDLSRIYDVIMRKGA